MGLHKLSQILKLQDSHEQTVLVELPHQATNAATNKNFVESELNYEKTFCESIAVFVDNYLRSAMRAFVATR